MFTSFPVGRRVLFISSMLSVIMRLGLPGNSTLENRFLSVDIASTLFYWDQRAAGDDVTAAGHLLEPKPVEVSKSGAPMLHHGDVEQQNRWASAHFKPLCTFRHL